MAIVYKKGFFSGEEAAKSGTELFVHGCNALGLMGAGVAAMVVRDFPWAYEAYAERHRRFGLELGEVHYAVTPHSSLVVANAITQQDVGTHRRQGDYEAIYSCLEDVSEAVEDDLENIAMVKIGCGLAGCEWDIVESMVKHFFANSRTQMTIYHTD